MTATRFTLADFRGATDPWAYILETGILQARSDEIRGELDQLRTALDSLDELRLAFALVVAEAHDAVGFGLDAARLLAHPSQSVRINAYRVLNAIEPRDITTELRTTVADELRHCPERRDFADALQRA